MGIEKAFLPSDPDFSGINTNNDLYISDVLHKAFVEVNEEGTEAAAVTSITIGVSSIGAGPPVFRADRPFIFSIRERQTGSIVFIGKVSNL